jgi:hypothetical protein
MAVVRTYEVEMKLVPLKVVLEVLFAGFPKLCTSFNVLLIKWEIAAWPPRELFVSLRFISRGTNSSDYIASNGRVTVNNELGKCGRNRSWPNLRFYPVICLDGLRKTAKNVSQDMKSYIFWDIMPCLAYS